MDWSTKFESTLRDFQKLKKAMMKKNLNYARAKCPECEGYLYGTILGKKNHLHMACNGSCNRKMIE